MPPARHRILMMIATRDVLSVSADTQIGGAFMFGTTRLAGWLRDRFGSTPIMGFGAMRRVRAPGAGSARHTSTLWWGRPPREATEAALLAPLRLMRRAPGGRPA